MKAKLKPPSVTHQLVQGHHTKLFSTQNAKHWIGGCLLIVATSSFAVEQAIPEILPDGFFKLNGLIWSKISSSRVTYTDAAQKCSGTLQGQTGWRVPTFDEFMYLYFETKDHGNDAINPDRIPAYVWTGSAYNFSRPEHTCWQLGYDNSRATGFYDDTAICQVSCVRTDKAAPLVIESAPVKIKPEPVKTGSATIGLKVDTSAADKAAKDKADAAAFKKSQAEQERIYQAEKRAEAAKRVANEAAREAKQRQWCMADQAARLGLCECSRYNPVKGNACRK